MRSSGPPSAEVGKVSLPAPLKATFRYLRRVFVAVDQLGNALTGGEPDETISYRAAVAQAAGSRPARLLCRALDLVEPDHCGIVRARRDTRATVIRAGSSR